jgi:hypothetical protein
MLVGQGFSIYGYMGEKKSVTPAGGLDHTIQYIHQSTVDRE